MLQKIEKQILKKISKHPDDISIKIESLKPYSGSEISSAMKSLKENSQFVYLLLLIHPANILYVYTSCLVGLR